MARSRRTRRPTRPPITKPRSTYSPTPFRDLRRITGPTIHSRRGATYQPLHRKPLKPRRYAPVYRPKRAPYGREYLLRTKPLRQTKVPDIHRLIRRATKPKLRKLLDICRKKAARRAVLLNIGRVNRAGGAPGPYRHDGVKC